MWFEVVKYMGANVEEGREMKKGEGNPFREKCALLIAVDLPFFQICKY